jgi:hypothetical protein
MTFDKPIVVGQCIYCCTTQGLTKEHIVPKGLNGTWVLQDARCTTCSRITGDLERVVLRDMLSPIRTALSLRMRRPDQRPSTYPAVRTGLSGEERIKVPISDYPAILTLPEPFPASHVTGATYPWPGFSRVWSKTLTDLSGIERQTAAGESMTVSYDIAPHEFRRFIATIAYGFAVAACGLPGIVETFVVPTILGRADEGMRWVGCTPGLGKIPGTTLHDASVNTDTEIIEVRVRLFACLGAPEYTVIVGRQVLRDVPIPSL